MAVSMFFLSKIVLAVCLYFFEYVFRMHYKRFIVDLKLAYTLLANHYNNLLCTGSRGGRKCKQTWDVSFFLLRRANADFMPSRQENLFLCENGFGECVTHHTHVADCEFVTSVPVYVAACRKLHHVSLL